MKGFLSSGTNLPEKSLFGVFTGHWFFLRDCSSLYRCSWNSLYTGSGEKQFLSWLEQSAVRMSKISGFGAAELSELLWPHREDLELGGTHKDHQDPSGSCPLVSWCCPLSLPLP